MHHADKDTIYETIANLHEVVWYNNKTQLFLQDIIYLYPSIWMQYQKYLASLQTVDFIDMAEVVFSSYLRLDTTKKLTTKQWNSAFLFYKSIVKKLAKGHNYKSTAKIIDHLHKSTLSLEDKLTIVAHNFDVIFGGVNEHEDKEESKDKKHNATTRILTHTHGIPRENRERLLLSSYSGLSKSEYQRTPLISYEINSSLSMDKPYPSTIGDQYRYTWIKNILGFQESDFSNESGEQSIPTPSTNVLDIIAQSDITEDELLHIIYSLFIEHRETIALGRYKEILLGGNTVVGVSVWGKLAEQIIIEFANNLKESLSKKPLRIGRFQLFQHLLSAGFSIQHIDKILSEETVIGIDQVKYHLNKIQNTITRINEVTIGFADILSLIQQLSKEHDTTSIVNTLISLFPTSVVIQHQEELKNLLPTFTYKDLKQHIYTIITSFFTKGTIPSGVTDFGKFIESIYLPQQLQIQDRLYTILREDLLLQKNYSTDDEQISLLQETFPTLSLQKEKQIAELLLKTNNTQAIESFLPHFNFPHIHNNLADHLLKTHTQKDIFDEQVSYICKLLPKKSMFRDQVIKDFMNQYSIALHKLDDIKTLLFEENFLFEPTTEVLYQYGGVQLLAQIFYYCPLEAKEHLFIEYCKSISQPHEQFVTEGQTAYIFSNFFSGKQSLFAHQKFEDLFRLLFISLKESDEVTSLFIQLQKVEEQLSDFNVIYKRLSEEVDEQEDDYTNYSYETTTRNYTHKPITDAEAKEFRIVFQLQLTTKRNNKDDGETGDLGDILSLIHMLKGYKRYLEKKIGLLPMKEIDLLVSIIHVVMTPFTPEEQGIIMGKFFAAFQHLPQKSLENATPLFLESIGTLFSKVGQYLATLGIIKNPGIISSLQKLMHSIRPDDMFRMIETRKQSGISLEEYFSVGPLLGSASARQAYANHTINMNSGVSKIKRQHALSTINTQARRLLQIVEIAKKHPLLSAFRLPKNMIHTAIEEAQAEVLTNADIQKQQWRHDHLHGKDIAGVTWHIPGIKSEHSNHLIQNDTLLFEGTPLGKYGSISQETKQAVLAMVFYMLSEYYAFHGDLNFGNILQSPTKQEYCLIDFANATKMTENEYKSLLTLIGLFTQFAENFESIIGYCASLHIENGGSLDDVDGVWLFKLTQRMKKSIEKNDIKGLQSLTTQITDFFVILESNNIILPTSLTTLIKGLGQITYFIEDNYETVAMWYISEQVKYDIQPTIEMPDHVTDTLKKRKEGSEESTLIEIPQQTTIKVGKRIYTVAQTTRITKGATTVRLNLKNETSDGIEDSPTFTVEISKQKEEIHQNTQVLLGGTYVSLWELVWDDE